MTQTLAVALNQAEAQNALATEEALIGQMHRKEVTSMATATAKKQQDTQTKEQKNTVEAVGYLQRQNVRQGRNSRQKLLVRDGLETRFLLALHEETGNSHILPVSVQGDMATIAPPDVQLQSGMRVKVTGHLSWHTVQDRRYSLPDTPHGWQHSVLQMTAEHLELAPVPEDDAEDPYIEGSWVTVRGEVTSTPQIVNHEDNPAEKVARLSLRVQTMKPSRRPGLVYPATERVAVDVATALPGVENALREGNIVEVQGLLQPFTRSVPQSHPVVQRVLAQKEQEWEARIKEAEARRTNRDGAPLPEPVRQRIVNEAREAVAEERHALLQEEQVRVRGGLIELIDGEPLALDEARTADNRRKRQRRKQRRRSGGSANGSSNGAQQNGASTQQKSTAAAPSTNNGSSKRQRPRRKPEAANGDTGNGDTQQDTVALESASEATDTKKEEPSSPPGSAASSTDPETAAPSAPGSADTSTDPETAAPTPA